MKTRRTSKLTTDSKEKLVSGLARQLQAQLLEARVTERLAFSPSDVKKFIEHIHRKDQNYSRAAVLDEFQKVFGQVNPGELQRIVNAGMDEAQRWQDYADGVVTKYEQSFPGRGRDKLVSIAKGDTDNAGITKSEAEQDKRRYLEAVGKYDSTRVLMELVWQVNQGK